MLTGNIFHKGCLQSLEEANSDLYTGFLVVQEMLTHWPNIVAYIKSNGPLQDFHHVVRCVSTSAFLSWFDFG